MNKCRICTAFLLSSIFCSNYDLISAEYLLNTTNLYDIDDVPLGDTYLQKILNTIHICMVFLLHEPGRFLDLNNNNY